jgi:hypothetical protein
MYELAVVGAKVELIGGLLLQTIALPNPLLPCASVTRSQCPPAPVKNLQWREFNCNVCFVSLGAKADIFHNHGKHRNLFTKTLVEFVRGAERRRQAKAQKPLLDVG